MPLSRLDDLDVQGRRVLVRVDFNAPLADGAITDDTRLRAAIPTIEWLRDAGARVILCSHLGRPKGKPDPRFSMEPVAAHLAGLLDAEIKLPDEVVGDAATRLVAEMRERDVVLLENLRFHPGERANSDEFASALAALADAYVNDAFGACHRAHASVVGVATRLRDRAAGRLVARENEALRRLLDEPARPFVAVVGGAKVSDKLGVLIALVERLHAGDKVIVGGAMANSFLAARGRDLGGSLVERDRFDDCRTVEIKAAARDVSLLLPSDLRLGRSLDDPNARAHVLDVESEAVHEADMALDIGAGTAARYAAALEDAGTVFWNGPMGVFENPAFAQGTLTVAQAVADCAGFTVVGGGDSVAAVNQSGLAETIDHISTGGGASLEFMESDGALPGLVALERANPAGEHENS
jgi:phosphoglycerate kinase